MNTYEQLSALPENSLVQDANGQVWLVKRRQSTVDETIEIWLCPFSDEYAAWYCSDGSSGGLGDTPTEPLIDLKIVSTRGA